MTADRKISARMLVAIAGICFAIILIVLAAMIAGGGTGRIPGIPAAPYASPAITQEATAIPLSLSGTCPAATPSLNARHGIPEVRENLNLVLTRPPDTDRVPYTERGFSQPVEAAVAWWMFPGFDEENRQFRNYHRSTPEQKAAFPAEERTFFDFITGNLDAAEGASSISSDITLFRGITPGVAGIVLNNAAWDEAPFASTSYDITVTVGQYASRDAEGYLNVLVIPGRAGKQILYINEDQREFLLPRGTAWDVVSVKMVENLTVNADFILHNPAERTARFTGVRLIYLEERICR
jgi:hypothetical protein